MILITGLITENVFQKKNKPHTNAYIRNLQRRYWWTYTKGSNGDADTENRFVDTAGEEEGGMNGESNMEMYILPYAK